MFWLVLRVLSVGMNILKIVGGVRSARFEACGLRGRRRLARLRFAQFRYLQRRFASEAATPTRSDVVFLFGGCVCVCVCASYMYKKND